MAFMHTFFQSCDQMKPALTTTSSKFLFFQSQGEIKERKPFPSLMENVLNVFSLTSATEVSRSEAWAQCM